MDNEIYEECGIFGICNNADAPKITAIGLHALQHRGQSACGIAVSHKKQIYTRKSRGRVLEVFELDNINLIGKTSIGHNRYPTSAVNNEKNIQPFVNKNFNFAIAHNGQINSKNSTISDSYQIIELIENACHNNIEQAFIHAINNIKGGFAILCLSGDKILAARDPIGIRPLVMGELNGSYLFCSESCALDAVGANFIREIENGEIILCDNNNIIQLQAPAPQPAKLCIFEYIYFARPDSHINNKYIYTIRKNMGKILANEAPAKADLVVPIQNSGTYAALGYAQQSNIDFELALAINNYTGRSFIYPNNHTRQYATQLKYSVIKDVIKNKDIILIDDSLVRGTTLKYIIAQLRKTEVGKIHLRIASPIFKYPDIYGIDIKKQSELLSYQYPTISEMAGYLNVDSLKFLSIDGLYTAINGNKRNNNCAQYTDHYFTGEYPLS